MTNSNVQHQAMSQLAMLACAMTLTLSLVAGQAQYYPYGNDDEYEWEQQWLNNTLLTPSPEPKHRDADLQAVLGLLYGPYIQSAG